MLTAHALTLLKPEQTSLQLTLDNTLASVCFPPTETSLPNKTKHELTSTISRRRPNHLAGMRAALEPHQRVSVIRRLSPSFLADLGHRLWFKTYLSDVTIRLCNGKELHLHRAVLSRSAYFETAFKQQASVSSALLS